MIKHRYDERAEDYDEKLSGHPGIYELRSIIMRDVKPKDDYTVLDVASGTGYYAVEFASCFTCVMDISEKMLMIARRKNVKNIIVGDAEYIPMKNDIFDIVICINALRYMDAERSIGEMARVLKPEGKLIVADIDKDKWKHTKGRHDFTNVYNKEEIRSLFGVLKDVKLRSFGIYFIAEGRKRRVEYA